MKRKPTIPLVIAGVCMLCIGASANQPPVANAGRDTTFIRGLGYGLSGDASTDDSLTKFDLIYAWKQISGPVPGIEILGPDSRNSGLDITVSGVYQFELTVSDGVFSDKDTVVVNILPAKPFIVLAPDTGDTIYTGRTYRVVWQVYPPTGMHVELSTDAGFTFVRQNETKIDEFDTSWLWEVPDTLPESDSCLIRVREYGHAVIHTISGYFYLRKGTINAVIPRASQVPGVVRILTGAFSVDGRRQSLTDLSSGVHPSCQMLVLRGAEGTNAAKKITSRKQ